MAHQLKAIFRPKNLATLRPGLEPFIGQTFTFWLGFHQDEGPYAGQQTYTFAPEHDDELGEHGGRWVPEEDLEFIKDS